MKSMNGEFGDQRSSAPTERARSGSIDAAMKLARRARCGFARVLLLRLRLACAGQLKRKGTWKQGPRSAVRLLIVANVVIIMQYGSGKGLGRQSPVEEHTLDAALLGLLFFHASECLLKLHLLGSFRCVDL